MQETLAQAAECQKESSVEKAHGTDNCKRLFHQVTCCGVLLGVAADWLVSSPASGAKVLNPCVGLQLGQCWVIHFITSLWLKYLFSHSNYFSQNYSVISSVGPCMLLELAQTFVTPDPPPHLSLVGSGHYMLIGCIPLQPLPTSVQVQWHHKTLAYIHTDPGWNPGLHSIH